jgi:hypothetical protein
VHWKSLGAAALIAAGAASAQAPLSQPARTCDIHIYPADGIHSVGEDFDAVKRLDQDLRDYYRAAGRSLDWLTPDRQLTLVSQLPIAQLVGADNGPTTMHPEPLTRHQALEPGPRQLGGGCVVEVMLPQLMLERGGLATRSLRVFGVVRRYDNGALTRSYSGFASSPMEGFRLKTPEDASAATSLVEQAYRHAVETVLRNSLKAPRK